jgi:DNA repair ATPase RecN
VAVVSDRLAAARPQRDARLAAIRTEMQVRQTDRSAIEQAHAHLAASKADKRLLGAIGIARERVEQIRADDSAVKETQRRVDELINQIATPPEPLFAVSGGEESGTHESRADPG